MWILKKKNRQLSKPKCPSKCSATNGVCFSPQPFELPRFPLNGPPAGGRRNFPRWSKPRPPVKKYGHRDGGSPWNPWTLRNCYDSFWTASSKLPKKWCVHGFFLFLSNMSSHLVGIFPIKTSKVAWGPNSWDSLKPEPRTEELLPQVVKNEMKFLGLSRWSTLALHTTSRWAQVICIFWFTLGKGGPNMILVCCLFLGCVFFQLGKICQWSKRCRKTQFPTPIQHVWSA